MVRMLVLILGFMGILLSRGGGRTANWDGKFLDYGGLTVREIETRSMYIFNSLKSTRISVLVIKVTFLQNPVSIQKPLESEEKKKEKADKMSCIYPPNLLLTLVPCLLKRHSINKIPTTNEYSPVLFILIRQNFKISRG